MLSGIKLCVKTVTFVFLCSAPSNLLIYDDVKDAPHIYTHKPEPRDHLGKSYDLLDAIGDQVGQVRQHGEAGALLLTGVRTAALLLVHHQQVVKVHFGVH